MEAAVRVAEILAQRGEMEEARRVLAEQRVLFAEHAVPLYIIEAEMLREQGYPAEGARVYDTALGAFPGDPELLYGRAMLAAAQGRLDVLERDLRTILDEDPDHADALNALGYTLADQTDRYQEAFELISRALKLKPESAAILDSMGWVQYRLGNLEAAIAYLQRAVEKDGNDEISAHLGEVLWVTGRRDEALKVWRDALELEPGSAIVRDTMQRLRTGQ
jgi:tetratricopeptide (TPR) repeat protein